MTDFSHFVIVELQYHFRLANAVSESPGSYMRAIDMVMHRDSSYELLPV